MIALLQRVKNSRVTVDGTEAGHIDLGLLILLGVMETDDEKDADFLAEKISCFRIFPDENEKMNLDIRQAGGKCLVVSQFTLCADWIRGRRPGFTAAAHPEKGETLYEYFCQRLRLNGIGVETGIFGAMMDVTLTNYGPVTFILDSNKKYPKNINK
jgi:D-tyrosyl-tRNA(Tyr) deacylase